MTPHAVLAQNNCRCTKETTLAQVAAHAIVEYAADDVLDRMCVRADTKEILEKTRGLLAMNVRKGACHRNLPEDGALS